VVPPLLPPDPPPVDLPPELPPLPPPVLGCPLLPELPGLIVVPESASSWTGSGLLEHAVERAQAATKVKDRVSND
jgi:hypothetical protein